MIEQYKRDFIFDTKEYWGKYVLSISLSLLSIWIGVVYPLLMQRLIDNGILNQNLNIIVIMTVVIIGMSLVENMISYIVNVLYGDIRKRYVLKTKRRVLEKIQRLSGEQLEELSDGYLLNIIENDIIDVADSVTDKVFMVIRNSIQAIFSMIIMIKIGWDIFLFLLICQVLLVVINKRLGHKVHQALEGCRRKEDSQRVVLQGHINNIAYLIQSNFAKYFTDKYMKEEKNVNQQFYDVNILYSKNIAASGFFNSLMGCIVWGIGGVKIIYSSMSIGDLYAFSSYSGRFLSPLMDLIQININLKSTWISLERIYSFFKIEEVQSVYKMKDRGEIQGDIKFENVGFSYLGREKILDKFNLRIYKNQINVILGHSGCGKSTIIKLLTKFWTIEKGTIYLDGVPLDEYSTEYIRNNISIVSQKTEIFQGTIRENIQLDLKIADEKLNEICKRAGIYDEIIKMDNGFETELLGEGNNISGGQRQRIAIARALAKESRIIVFDEPTSNLDIGNVKKICNLIFDIKDRTVILITHDLKLAQKAENICVLDK